MSATPLVLVVDDDPSILRLLRLQLAEDGFQIVTADSGKSALRVAEERRPDLVVLDLTLPDLSGYEVMRRIRERSSMPVVMLTARGSDHDKIRGLELGADDYIAKPFNPEELSARIRAVLRRAHRTVGGSPVVQIRDLKIDLERRVAERDGQLIPLTRTEWNLLDVLAQNAGKVMTNHEILGKVWGPEYVDDLQYLRVWISRLRRKLESDRPEGSVIRTFTGHGYMLEAGENGDAQPDAEMAAAEPQSESEAEPQPSMPAPER